MRSSSTSSAARNPCMALTSTGKNPAMATMVTLDPMVSPNASISTVTMATYGTLRSVIAAGMSATRVAGTASNRMARPIPAMLATRNPIPATCNVAIRCTVMSSGSPNSASTTRSGRGITNAGRPENRIARYHNARIEQIGAITRSNGPRIRGARGASAGCASAWVADIRPPADRTAGPAHGG